MNQSVQIRLTSLLFHNGVSCSLIQSRGLQGVITIGTEANKVRIYTLLTACAAMSRTNKEHNGNNTFFSALW